MLPIVSAEAQEDGPASEPLYPQRYPVKPPVMLSDIHVFTKGHPFDAYETLRDESPVCWHPEPYQGEPDGPGFWAITRYDDVKAVELDTETFSSQKGGINLSYGAPEMRHPLLHAASFNSMICLDKPFHFPLRRAHMPFFTPAFIKALRERVEEKVDALLDDVEAAGPRLDMVEHFSQHLPLFTLCEILGVPEADRPKLIDWMHHLERAIDTIQQQNLETVDPTQLANFLMEMQAMFEFGRSILISRREDPKEDLLSAIANAEVEGEKLPEPFLDGSWLLIVFAGSDTTRNALSGTMRLLTEHKDQKQLVLDDPALIPGMVNEALRMVSPVIYMRRTATRDAELAEQKIAAGEKVVMFYGAANRDGAVFENPDEFDIRRQNASDHIAFGHGPHVCLGQRVASMQLETAYKKILERFPNVEATGAVEFAPNNFVHAFSKLEIALNGA